MQTRFKELSPIVDCVKSVPLACEFFALLQAVYVFVSCSKVNIVYEKAQAHHRPGKQLRRLKRLIETCWSCNYDAIQAIKETFGALLSTLQFVSDSDYDSSVEAKGLLLQVDSFKFVVCLIMLDHLFSLTNGLSKILQAPDLAAAISLIDTTVQT